jgi:ethanolamine ammonia-lyase small subunit
MHLTELPAKPEYAASQEPSLVEAIRQRTPARILMDSAGPAYCTPTWLELRGDHAAAIDAVREEFELARDLPAELISQHGLFTVQSLAHSKQEYLLRPDLGRRLSDAAREQLTRRCGAGADIQFVIGDGLSTAAVRTQVPELLPLLVAGATARGWKCGQPFTVEYCRVGVLNDIGELLSPAVAVLLIGERPGLATAESLSAYLAYRPRAGHTDAQRNLISNIHARGIPCAAAAGRILALAELLLQRQASGVAIKEQPLAGLASPVLQSPQLS